MEHSEDLAATARFFDRAISEIAHVARTRQLQVLDFGCGSGELVAHLAGLGYDAYGCDIVLARDAPRIVAAPQRFGQIDLDPYRLPFDDASFDVVVSTSVLEHARNPEQYLVEIRRVLRPGGAAMHLLPGKWYLPYEPHIRVPLANYFYPNCPSWWFAFWMLVGKRHPHHQDLDLRDAVKACRDFYDNGVFYLSSRQHERLSRAVFGNCEWPMTFYITHGHGGFARLCRRLPMRGLWGALSREFRMAFLVQRKQPAS
ncbi:MAG: class I SAM-dependent methyltransferase [Xanthobacteraceae bacterium]